MVGLRTELRHYIYLRVIWIIMACNLKVGNWVNGRRTYGTKTQKYSSRHLLGELIVVLQGEKKSLYLHDLGATVCMLSKIFWSLTSLSNSPWYDLGSIALIKTLIEHKKKENIFSNVKCVLSLPHFFFAATWFKKWKGIGILM